MQKMHRLRFLCASTPPRSGRCQGSCLPVDLARPSENQPGNSNTAIDSTWEVCGNMFTTPAFFKT
jgi:hypothetical protein